MLDAHPPRTPTTPSDPDWEIRLVQWRLSLLEETAQIAMEVQRAMRDDIITEQRFEAGILRNPDGDTLPASVLVAIGTRKERRDHAVALDRASRAVRLTLLLHGRTQKELRRLFDGVAADQAARADARAKAQSEAQAAAQTERVARRKAQVERVRDCVREVADREIGDPDEARALEQALAERLENDPAYAGEGDMPLEPAVRRLCADLGLEPDWSRWTGDGWPPRPPFSRPRSSPFATPSRRPSAAWAKRVADDAALHKRLQDRKRLLE